MNVPGLKSQPGAPGLDHHQTNNNTEAGDIESSEEQALKIQQLKGQQTQHIINMPGMIPQKKNKFQEWWVVGSDSKNEYFAESSELKE